MTNIVVLIKQVPDTWSERKLSEDDWTLDREAADAVLDEINERAVEEALLGLCKRRLVAFDGTRYTPVEAEKETLDFYARSIRHLIG